MVKDHLESERENPLLPLRGLGFLKCTIPDRIAHTMAFVIPVVEHWLEQDIAEWVHHEGSIWGMKAKIKETWWTPQEK